MIVNNKLRRSHAVDNSCGLTPKSYTTLGVTLDSNLTLNKHVSSVCKSAYNSIKALRHIRPVRFTCGQSCRGALTSPTRYLLELLVSILINFNVFKTALLEWYFKIITIQLPVPPQSLLSELHWLSVNNRINFKIATLRTSHLFLVSYLSSV